MGANFYLKAKLRHAKFIKKLFYKKSPLEIVPSFTVSKRFITEKLKAYEEILYFDTLRFLDR